MLKFAAVAGVLLTASAGGAQAQTYRAEITRTAYGIPHVTATSWSSLGFGEAYAVLQNDLCLLADKIVTVNGERSRWFGADGSTTVAFAETPNLYSDVLFKTMMDAPKPRAAFSTSPPEYQALVRGYVAGFNRCIAKHTAASRPQACRGG